MKKYLLLIACLMLLLLSGCKDNNSDKAEVKEKEQVKKSYNSVSGITALATNNTWKYTEDNMDCQLYEWSEEVVLPIPKPDGTTGIKYVSNGYYLLGVSYEEWQAYAEVMSEKYDANITYDSMLSENDIGNIYIYDMDNNFMANIIWDSDFSTYNLKNVVSSWVYVGSREQNTTLNNREVLDKALEKLQIDDGTGFSIINISSQSNLKDGFDVYYLSTAKEYYEANEDNAYMYLCVVKDDEIVLLEPDCIRIGDNDSLEFIEVDGGYKMYIVTTTYLSGNSYSGVTTYTLEENGFIKESEETSYEIEALNYNSHIALKKNEDVIDIYNINQNEDMYYEEIPYYETWLLGEKIAVIDDEGIKKVEAEVQSSSESETENETENETEYEEDVDTEVVESNISYRFEGDTLYVSGTGYVDEEDKSKWEEYIIDIEKIVIEPGVTTIGYSAFRDMPCLEEVVIADTVKIIESEAFFGCFELNYIQLPEGLEVIDSQAFCDCDLLSLDIPDSVTEIGYEAFAYSINLDNYEIPKDIDLERHAFYRTKMLDDLVAENQVAVVDGVLYDGRSVKGDFVIPDGVTEIAEEAFYYNKELLSVEIPDSVEFIGSGAFENCENLVSVKCYAELEDVEGYIFNQCHSLETVQLAEGTKVISDGMFSECSSLKTINIPDSVEIVGGGAFEYCTSLESIDMSGKVQRLGSSAFFGCENLKSIYLSESLTGVGESVFGMCFSLETMYGVQGSYAEEFARDLDREFISQ